MNDNHIKSYSREDVAEILRIIQTCVANDRFVVSRNINRTENVKFVDRYNLTKPKVKHIISEIEVTDFCYGLHNEHAGYEHEILYVFCPQVELSYEDDLDVVDIYIKFNIINGEKVIVISFHPRNFPVDYLFTV